MKATLGQLLLELQILAQPFNFLRGGLGALVADLAVLGIIQHTTAQVDPDGIPWPPLSQSYQAWKDTVAPNAPIGHLYGLMLSQAELEGTRTIYAHTVIVAYGITDVARIEATKFQEGGIVTGTNQPQRPFYAFTTAAIPLIDQLFEHIFATFIV